ncbi:MAG: lysine 2,3-aminomutase [Candidatus Shapirobacteria bacterium]|jgi:lysine 2,3-aminomutase
MQYAKAKKHPYWKNISNKDWMDWRWQMKNSVGTADELGKILDLPKDRIEEIKKSLKILRMAITPYYLSQIDIKDPHCPIGLQAIPSIKETNIGESDLEDPLHEEADCPVKGLEGVITHRYPDRLIMYVTYQCSMYCRHCTRRRHAGETDLPTPFSKILKAIEYIRKTKTVRDVLITGGDPLILETDYLEKIIKEIRAISHVEVIRIGTRVPVVLPMRIDKKLINMLRKYHPIWMNTHFNHPKEMTDLAAKASQMIADGGIPLGNQTVLMRGINNHPLLMKKLMKLLVANRIRPYYIYQCDMSQGISHFRTKISEGVEIIENLRGHMSGFAVPNFCVDGLGGGGKTPVMPNYVVSQSNHKWVFRNYEGLLFAYNEPTDYTYEPPVNVEKYIDQSDVTELQGVAELLSEKSNKINIVPNDLRRLKRRQK